MITLLATIKNHVFRLTAQDGNSMLELPTGSKQIDAIQVTFTGDDWAAADVKKMIFWQDNRAPFASTIDVNGVAMVPDAALFDRGAINIAAYGESVQDGEVVSRITTNTIRIKVIQGALTSSTAPAPSPSLFEQAVLAGVERVIELQQSESAAAANAAAALANAAASHAEAAAAGATLFLHPTGSAIAATSYIVGESIGTSVSEAGKAIQNTERARTSLLTRSNQTRSRLAVSLDLEEYEYKIALYESPASAVSGAGFLGYQDTNGWTTGMTVISSTAEEFILVFRHVVSGVEQTISASDISAISAALNVYSTTDSTLTQPFVPADAKATGDILSRHEDMLSSHEEEIGCVVFEDTDNDDKYLCKFKAVHGKPIITYTIL